MTARSPEPRDAESASGDGAKDFGVVDSHIHQWDPLTTPRPASLWARIVRRLPSLERALPAVMPVRDRDFVGDLRYVLRPYLVADYAADTMPQVDSVVHIEASWSGKGPLSSVDETVWVANLPFGQSGAARLGAIVAHADPREPQIAELLDAHFRASALVRGVRLSAAHHPDRNVRCFTDDPHLLGRAKFLRGFAAIAERGLSFEAWVYSHQLSEVEVLAIAYPDTTIVLDHYATPVGGLGPIGKVGVTAQERADIYKKWVDDIAAVAALPNVVAKHSGAGMPVLGLPRQSLGHPVPRRQLRDAIAPYVTHTHQVFGNERTLWGSNYPIDKPTQSVATSAWLLEDIIGNGLDRRKVFHDNAQRIYRLA